MPEYKYLEDGTPVTAEEFNTRFDALMGPTKGVNNVTPDMLALGALRHNQIPCLIGKKGATEESLEGGFTRETLRDFIRSTGSSSGVEVTACTLTEGEDMTWESLYRHTFAQPIERSSVSRPGLQDAHAIIFLANIHVNRFEKSGSQISDADLKRTMRERALGIAFQLVVELDDVLDFSGAVTEGTITLRSSARSVSPGFTIDFNVSGTGDPDTGSGYPMVESGVTAPNDYLTFKDVALRAVLEVPEPLPGRTYHIKAVRIDASIFGRDCSNVKARIDKINLTAIPIHAKVDKHGGS